MAQVQPMAGGGGGALTVYTIPTADPVRAPSSGLYSVPFWVVNTTAAQVAVDFGCSKTGPMTCETVTPLSGVIPTNDSLQVSVTYSTTASLGVGGVTLTATPDGPSPPPATSTRWVQVANLGKAVPWFLAGTNDLDRGFCLTLGGGEGGGISCGDLFLVEGMPAYRTLGRDRSLALHYNSATAHGLTLVVVECPPIGRDTPDAVT